MEKLTSRQQQVLDIVRQHIDQTGYPPTRADIARELGFKSANAAEEHLKALARKGRHRNDRRGVARHPPAGERRHPRSWGESRRVIRCWRNRISRTTVTCRPVFQTQCRLLSRGPGRQHDGYRDSGRRPAGRAQHPVANNGDIVVARIEDEVTVKRLRRTGQKHLVELIPENADYEPIRVNLQEQAFTIEGISVGCCRGS